jgi:hypothetical protein
MKGIRNRARKSRKHAGREAGRLRVTLGEVVERVVFVDTPGLGSLAANGAIGTSAQLQFRRDIDRRWLDSDPG